MIEWNAHVKKKKHTKIILNWANYDKRKIIIINKGTERKKISNNRGII